MHSPNASLRGSSLSPKFDSTEKSQSDLYLLYSTVNSFNSSPNALHTLYSLVTGNRIDVDIDLENESSAIFLADYEGDKVTTTLASLNESWPFGLSGDANMTELEEVLGPVRDPFFTVLLMTIVYTFILVTGVCGNLLTCLVIARRRYMHTATNYYLFSLSISDLLLLILGLPQDMVLLWQKYPYIFSEAFCILRGLTSEICTNCSILVIVGFTIERYIAICHPLISHTTLKLSRVVKIIALTWVIGTLSAIPIAWQFGIVYVYNQNQQPYPGSDHCAVKRLIYPYIFELTTMVFFVLPITIIIVLYILIGIKLRASSTGSDRQIKGTRKGRVSSTGKSLESRHPLSMSIRRQNNSRRAVIRMLVAVVIAFFFCFAPFHAQRVLAIVMNRNEVSDDKFIQIFTILTHISGVTYYLSSVLNPILYQVMSKKFQLALRETLPCCTKLADPNDADLAFSTVLPTSRQGNSHSPSHASKQASFYSSSSPKKLADSKS